MPKPGFHIRQQVDTLHGESDGLPYHWRVFWVVILSSGLEVKYKTIRSGRESSQYVAKLETLIWGTAAKDAGPYGEPDPNHIPGVSKWQGTERRPPAGSAGDVWRN